MSLTAKLIQMVIVIALFGGVMTVILLAASRLKFKSAERVQAAAFLVPTLVLVAFGLLYPAISTVIASFQDSLGTGFVGLDNYKSIVSDGDQLVVLRNTALWVLLVPTLSTLVGLVYAVLVDGSRFEKAAKSLIFLPMAISLVGASIIWKFVYAYRANNIGGGDVSQIGLLNGILDSLGLPTYQFLINPPWNTLFLIVILVWVQAGFAMVVLSAAIKAIPDDIVEAARLDGVSGLKMFRYITVPSIRPSLIVVLTTISIATLKVFDIVQTTYGGQFDTSVLAYEFYRQYFVANNEGLAAALATVIFLLVTPIIYYNVRQMRRLEAR